MSDPTKAGLDLADYFAAATGAIVVGVGSAMAWFSRTKEKLLDRIAAVEDKMDKHFELDETRHREHSVTLERLESNQTHTHERLAELKDQIRVSALNGAFAVTQKFEDMMEEIRNMKNK